MSTQIGSFMGLDVYAAPALHFDTIEFRNGSQVVARLAIDAVSIQGTEIARTARAAVTAEKAAKG